METIAKLSCRCNACDAELGEYSPQQHKNITVSFPTKETRTNGTESYSCMTAHFCSKGCLANFLGGDKSSSLASYSAEAKLITQCDGCGKSIDTKDKDDQEEAITATLRGSDGVNKNFHLHNEACLADLLDKRRKTKKAYKAKASVESEGGIWSLDIAADESYARYISTKERNKKSEYFLDEKRKSFPIENCTDVKAAVSSWGRYTGDMSFSEFKSKLTARAKALGCPVPDKWEEEKKK